MALAFVGLGANLGGGMELLAQRLREALAGLQALPGTQLLRVSGAYRSAPVEASGPDFLNAVAMLHTGLQPLELLDGLQGLEQDFGRVRSYRNAPRTLDLDLLWFDGLEFESERLTLPHPRAELRAFVMKPLAELAPELRWPGGSTVRALAAAIDGQRIDRILLSLSED